MSPVQTELGHQKTPLRGSRMHAAYCFADCAFLLQRGHRKYRTYSFDLYRNKLHNACTLATDGQTKPLAGARSSNVLFCVSWTWLHAVSVLSSQAATMPLKERKASIKTLKYPSRVAAAPSALGLWAARPFLSAFAGKAQVLKNRRSAFSFSSRARATQSTSESSSAARSALPADRPQPF